MAKTRTDPIYVRSVTTNLKNRGDQATTFTLGPKTLILGSNTSRKSTILQSIELALTGAADDLVGRFNVREAGLLISLVSGDQLDTSVDISDDSSAAFSLKRGKKAKLDSGHQGALVLRQVRHALAGSTASARKLFLTWSAGSVSRSDVLANMPTHLHTKYEDIADKQKGNEVGCLLAVAEYAATRQRDAAKEIRGAQAVLDAGMDNELETRPTESDLEYARQAVESSRDRLDLAIRAEASQPSSGLSRSDLMANQQATASTLQAWQERLATSDARLKQCQADPTVQQAHDILQWAVTHQRDNCPVCSSLVGQGHLNACRNAYAAALTGPSIELKEQHAFAVSQVNEHAAQLKLIQSTLARLPVETAQAVTSFRQLVSISTKDAKDQLAEVQTKLSYLQQTHARWGDLSRSRDVVAAMKKQGSDYKELLKVCEQAIGALLDNRSVAFAERVQAYLPDDWVFSIELRDGKKEVFRMGLRRDGNLHCALSGAEWAAVTTAIAAAIEEIESQKKLSVLIPEDRAWDGKTLAKVMRSLGAFPGQVIMASTTKPSGRTPSGWTIVDMDSFAKAEDTAAEDTVTEAAESSDAPVEKEVEEAGNGSSRPSRASAQRILVGLGYDDKQIKRMSQDTAADVIRKGLFSSSVSIMRDGSYQVTADNIVPMPPR